LFFSPLLSEPHVEHHDELAGAVISGHLDPEDEEVGTEVYIEALPAVAGDDPAWDDESVYIDLGTLLEGGRPSPAEEFDWEPAWPPVSGGAPVPCTDLEELLEAWDVAAAEEMRRLEAGRPVPMPGAYEPTAADLAEMARWADGLDARGDWPREKSALGSQPHLCENLR
jgi:hypothetical protein